MQCDEKYHPTSERKPYPGGKRAFHSWCNPVHYSADTNYVHNGWHSFFYGCFVAMTSGFVVMKKPEYILLTIGL